MNFFLGFISGILFLTAVYYTHELILKRRKNRPIELRKGIVELGFNYTDSSSGERKSCTTEVEILEISRTDKKSKIQVLKDLMHGGVTQEHIEMAALDSLCDDILQELGEIERYDDVKRAMMNMFFFGQISGK